MENRRYVYVLLSVLTVFFVGQLAYSQVIVLKETVSDDVAEDDYGFGPNRKSFNHPYFGLGSFLGLYSHDGKGDDIEPTQFFQSVDLTVGTRFYSNWGKVFAGVVDPEIGVSILRLKAKDSMSLPVSSVSLKKAKYLFSKVGLNLALQINFQPKRGNQLGTYIQLGGYGGLNWVRRFIANYNADASVYEKSYKLSLKRLRYINRWEYGPLFRWGRSNFLLFAKYRLSNSITSSFSGNKFQELPRFTVGVQLFPGNI